MATISKHSATTSSPALTRLAELRALADSAPRQAQEHVWEWLKQLGEQDDQAALAELFGQGTASSPRTRTIGMPVGPMRNMRGAATLTAILRVDSPWTGKTFHADGSGGFNRVKLYSAPVIALLRQPVRREGRELTGFAFDTTISPGVVEPHVDVLAIEYGAPQHNNPSSVFPLTRIRDELVEIAPGTYLGRATFAQRPSEYVLVGYFALKRSVTGTEA